MTTRYTKDHEWIRIDGEFAYLGISQYAQEQLGDVVFVELPEPGKKLAKGDVAAVVESVKAASEVFTPAAAEVVAVNAALADTPALVNASPEGDGWFIKLKLAHAGEIDGLMDAAAYKSFTDTL